MQFDINFKVDHLDRALAAVRKGLEHHDKLLGSVGETLLNVNRNRHAAGLAPDGSKWKPLAPSTIGSAIWNKQGKSFRKNGTMSLAVARKVQAKRAGGVLYASGDMLNSFQKQVNGDTLTLGFDGDREGRLASWHHSGTQPYVITPKKAKALAFGGLCVKRVNHPGLPARPLVGFPDSDRSLAVAAVDDYLKVILSRVR
ncbi:MAG: phage virion morphogenesis protein [Methylophilaceae bacterium]